MSFIGYLVSIKNRAKEEKEILDYLSTKKKWNKIEIRAAKNSIGVLIESLIGKSKRILKHYNCPIIPQRSKDAIYILYEVGAISEEDFRAFSKAIGFRNILVHDYLEFNEDILINLIQNKEYETIYQFLIDNVDFKDVIIKRIENFIL